MASRIVDNSEAFLADYDRLAPDRRFHVLAAENVMSYAQFLDAKKGYSVLDVDLMAQIASELLDPIINSDAALDDKAIETILENAADIAIHELQSFTGATKPPVEDGRRDRSVHPGQWANITTELASNYFTRVNRRELKQHPYDEPPEVADVSKYPRKKSSPTI